MLYRLALSIPLLLAPSLARAHAILMASDPPAGGTVAPGAATLQLQYNSRIDQGRSKVTLSRQNGPDERLKFLPSQQPDMLRANAALTPGDYTLHWFVLATDGHITRGDVPFTVKAASQATK
ncbi:MAG: copper resistance protein CopC [Acetobacteraceae bacterium]|nr:copper resistance protein CopC [Acetobacteraceae bacterium]